MTQPDPQPDAAAPAAGEPPPGCFDVRFSADPFGGHKRGIQRLDLAGKGQLCFDGDAIVLRGRRRVMLWFGKPAEVRQPCGQVWNARCQGKRVSFDFFPPDAAPCPVSFTAADAGTALAVAARLPSRTTDAFEADQLARIDFLTRLNALSPSAPVTPALVALNCLVFIAMVLGGASILTPSGDVAIRWGSNFGPMTASGQWWRLLSSTFIHFGLLHLALNMAALYQTGVLVERMYGSVHFVVLYLFAGLSGSVLSTIWHPMNNSAGASGAIFGVFGGLLVFMLNKRSQVPNSVVIATRNSTLAFIAFNLFNGFAHAGIDNGAHLGGLLGGAAMGLMLARPLDAAQRRHPAPRLALAAALGALLLVGAVLAFFPARQDATQELKFAQSMQDFGPREAHALEAFDDLAKRLKEGTMDKAAAALAIDLQLVPQWDQMYESIVAAQVPVGSKDAALRQALLQYCDQRRKYLHLVSALLRGGDHDLQAQIAQAGLDLKARIEDVKSLSTPR